MHLPEFSGYFNVFFASYNFMVKFIYDNLLIKIYIEEDFAVFYNIKNLTIAIIIQHSEIFSVNVSNCNI